MGFEVTSERPAAFQPQSDRAPHGRRPNTKGVGLKVLKKEESMRFTSRLIAVGFGVMALVAVGSAQEASRVYPSGNGVTSPSIVKEVKPVYTREAREAGIQGMVYLSAVVLKDGTVGDVDVSQSLDKKYGLDEQAVKAVKQWLFKPGTKNGKRVAVRIDIQMLFALKQKGRPELQPAGQSHFESKALSPELLLLSRDDVVRPA
jgi:TonB family protein